MYHCTLCSRNHDCVRKAANSRDARICRARPQSPFIPNHEAFEKCNVSYWKQNKQKSVTSAWENRILGECQEGGCTTPVTIHPKWWSASALSEHGVHYYVLLYINVYSYKWRELLYINIRYIRIYSYIFYYDILLYGVFSFVSFFEYGGFSFVVFIQIW